MSSDEICILTLDAQVILKIHIYLFIFGCNSQLPQITVVFGFLLVACQRSFPGHGILVPQPEIKLWSSIGS